jgi:hypothetical protein
VAARIAAADARRPAVNPGNPLGNAVKTAIIYGSSQSARWIRTFIHLGFNEDENGNRVFDGAIPHKGPRGSFNVRWAQPTRLSGTQHTEAQFPGGESPHTWDTSYDPIAGVLGGQLDRCRQTRTCPKIVETVTDTEYWQSGMSLTTTDAKGRRDVVVPSDVRIYLFSGVSPRWRRRDRAAAGGAPNPPANCQLARDSAPFIFGQRALLVALRDWLVDGTEPPPSQYPRLRDGTAGSRQQHSLSVYPRREFRAVRCVRAKVLPQSRLPVRHGRCVRRDGGTAGASRTYPALAPSVDADGNTIAGLRHVNLDVPLGTYMGSNVRKAGFSEGDSCDLTGSFVPFFKTRAERTRSRRSAPRRWRTVSDSRRLCEQVILASLNLVRQAAAASRGCAVCHHQASAAAVP